MIYINGNYREETTEELKAAEEIQKQWEQEQANKPLPLEETVAKQAEEIKALREEIDLLTSGATV